MLHSIECEQCGKIFQHANKRRRFCSIQCSNERTKGKQFRTTTHICENCGKEYRPKQADRTRFCSRECAFEWKTKQSQEKKQSEEKARIEAWPRCKQCGKPVKEYRHCFCSDECRKQNARDKALEYGKKKHITIKVKCLECGVEFERGYGNKKRLFCSDKCNLKHNKQDHRRRARARKYTDQIEQFHAKEIFDRDKWICQICNKPIKRDTKYSHPLSATIDHIVPLSKGGTHERGNVQCAHRVCNSRKSDSVAP